MKRKRDHLANAALAMAIVGTASAEYQLARESGWGVVSFALPGALDVYAVRAMRAHRDVALMAAVMFGVNAMSHLVSAGLLTAAWPVVVAVSALPILVLVRVHAIRETTPEPGAGILDVIQDSAEVPAEPAPEAVVIERVAEVAKGSATTFPALTLGPLTPVAELLARPAPAQDPEPVALLTVADVAKALDVAEGTVRSWVSRNKLTPAQRDNGRMLFDPADIAALT